MGKIRIYQLARELDIQSKELVNILQDLGIEITSHMSTINDETADLVRGVIVGEVETDEKEEKEETKEMGKTTENIEQEITDEKAAANEKDISLEDKDKSSQVKSSRDKFEIHPPLSLKDFADNIDYPANRIIKELMNLGVMANLNHTLDEELLELLKDELDLPIQIISEEDEEKEETDIILEIEEKPEDLKPRPPIVTVMGHVDHGKTTLLDVIRKARVAESEAGGITQHIGAYQVKVNDQKITFVDTPGHEAFTAMRARGAQITDIVILVVAADDGVMPQTAEAINHAQSADIPIIVAINKIDKANAQPDRVKQQLTEYQLVTEEWGGDTICVSISALKEENIEELLEMVLLVAEMEEIKANPNRPAAGIIIEAELDKGRGPVATVIVKNGTLHVGDPLLAGSTSGRVRAMLDENGDRIEEVLPSAPAEVLGFSDVPDAGDIVRVVPDEKKARNIAEKRQEELHEQEIKQESRISLEDLYQQIQEGEIKELNLIIKADVQGSIGALKGALGRLGTNEVTVNIIHTGVGAINETDVNLASASNAIIIGFNVRPDSNARILAEKEKVDIRSYRVIYKVIDEIKDAMAGLLDPEIKEEIKGRAQVRETFKVPDIGIIAGVYINEGVINRNHQVRLIRDGVVVHEGEISSLKRFEDDVREVREGYECGVGIANFNDIKTGDTLEIFDYREIRRSL